MLCYKISRNSKAENDKKGCHGEALEPWCAGLTNARLLHSDCWRFKATGIVQRPLPTWFECLTMTPTTEQNSGNSVIQKIPVQTKKQTTKKGPDPIEASFMYLKCVY